MTRALPRKRAWCGPKREPKSEPNALDDVLPYTLLPTTPLCGLPDLHERCRQVNQIWEQLNMMKIHVSIPGTGVVKPLGKR